MNEEHELSNRVYCVRCEVPMPKIMVMPVRTGGISGFFSGWGESSERILELDVFRCPRCGKLEFFDLDKSLPHE